MSKVDVDYPPVYRGKSRFPKHQQATVTMENGGQRPSRLMQLQSNYQHKLMKEKEEKLIQLYEENQKRALQRVNSKGSIRDFFNERRRLEQNGNALPPVNQQYKQRQPEPKPVYSNGWTQRQNSGKAGNGTVQNMNIVGRDKSRPLAPIDHNFGYQSNIPQKPQRHGRPWTKDNITQERKSAKNDGARSAPSSVVQNGYHSRNSPNDETPPPNLSHIKGLQKQKAVGNRSAAKPPSGKKQMTDFQKWQMEQDQNRAERLKKIQPEPTPKYEYEESDKEEEDNESSAEIQRKQQELMAKIAEQQAALERMRKERAKEEEAARREREKRQKREEERQRKMREEEDRRRLEELDRKAQEALELERQEEEEIASTHAFNQYSHRGSHYNAPSDEENDDRYSKQTHYKTQPTPPPQPKPVRVQRKPVKHVTKPSRTPPISSSQNMSLYENAAFGEDAFDSGNTVLVACSNCHRKFASDRIDKHKKFCGNITKKRKVLDPTKMRVEGTDMEKYANNPRRRSRTPPKKKSNWRKKHENFMNTIRYAKKVTEMEKTGGNMSSLPPPPPSDTSDYVQCQWCSRKFSPSVAERHIPKCKDIKSRPAPLRR